MPGVKNICLTGAAGFIGTNLADVLKNRTDLNIIPYEGDILDLVSLDNFFSTNKIDLIVHLAGFFAGDEKTLIDANFQTTLNMLIMAEKYNVKKIVYSSTGAVYGELVDERSKETDPIKPNTFYGLTKKLAEEAIYFYSENYGIDYVILRFSNVYGKNNNKGVVNLFINSIKEKGEITIYGDGKASRDFLYVLDACQALEKAIDYNKSDVFNISNPKKITLNDLANILKKSFQFEIKYKEESSNNVKDLLLDITKAQGLLNYEPNYKDIQI